MEFRTGNEKYAQMRRAFRRVALLTLIATATITFASADPVPYGVGAYAFAQASDLAGGTSFAVQGTANNTGEIIPGLLAYTQPNVSAEASFSDGLTYGGSGANAFGTVSLGKITAFAQADSQTLEEGPVRLSGDTGRGNFGGKFQDQITVVSSTLPEFTPVLVFATLTLHSLESVACQSPDCSNASIAQANFDVSGTQGGGGVYLLNSASSQAPETMVLYFFTFVGDTIDIHGSLYADATAEGQTDGSIAKAIADAGDTARFFFDVVTPGASYMTASGTAYFTPTPVPEPSTIALIGSVLMLVVFRIIRRDRSCKNILSRFCRGSRLG
jgi:PEP-CTERM motif-containing protein